MTISVQEVPALAEGLATGDCCDELLTGSGADHDPETLLLMLLP